MRQVLNAFRIVPFKYKTAGLDPGNGRMNGWGC